MVALSERKIKDHKTVELSFTKPAGLKHHKGQYAILNLKNPKVTDLDLPYRWLPVVSSPEEDAIQFHIERDGSSFSKSCELIEVGDQAVVFGPMV